MIDLDGLEKHLTELVAEGFGGHRVTKAEDVMALVGLLREAERDAVRYRWLRDELAHSEGGIVLFDGHLPRANLDEFVDGAM